MDRKSTITLVSLVVLVSVFLSACGGPTGDVSPAMELDASSDAMLDGKALLEQRCVQCHTLDRVEKASISAEEWGVNVRRMVSKGAELTLSEQDMLIEYLSITYP